MGNGSGCAIDERACRAFKGNWGLCMSGPAQVVGYMLYHMCRPTDTQGADAQYTSGPAWVMEVGVQ